MTNAADIAIIGPGTVGTAIGVLSARAGLSVIVAGRNRTKSAAAAETIGSNASVAEMSEAASAAKLILLTVSDGAIGDVCDELSASGAFVAGAVVAHCSGAFGSEILASAREAGCVVGSMHPLQTCPTVERAVEGFSGGETFCFCEGDDEAVVALEKLAETIGARPARMSRAGKALYHAAACMACNYQATLVDAALAMCEQADIDRDTALLALGPLVRAMAGNIAEIGPAKALTGPIARGEVEVVKRHLAALADSAEELVELYCAAGLRTADLARRRGTIDDATLEALRETLNNRKEK